MTKCLPCCSFNAGWDPGPTQDSTSLGPEIIENSMCASLFNCHCEGLFPDSINNLECSRCEFFYHGECYGLYQDTFTSADKVAGFICGPCSVQKSIPCSSPFIQKFYEKREIMDSRDVLIFKQRALTARIAGCLIQRDLLSFVGKHERRIILFLRLKLGLCTKNAVLLHQFMKLNGFVKGGGNGPLMNEAELQNKLKTWREMEPREDLSMDDNRSEVDITKDNFLNDEVGDGDNMTETGAEKNKISPTKIRTKQFTRLQLLGNIDLHEKNSFLTNPGLEKINSFPCKECNEKFNTYSTWRIHTNFVHLKKHYPCDKCEYVASRTSHLNQHKTNVHSSKQIKCFLCSFTTTGNNYLVKHIKSVHDVSEAKYPCDQCEHVSKNPKNLKFHVRLKHVNGIRFECDQCAYFSPMKYLLKEHKAIKHEGVRFQCDQCVYSATKMYYLKLHIQSKHEGVVRILCDECEYTCNHSTHLKMHKKTKHSYAHPCDKCEFSGGTLYHLNKHKASQHKQYSCNKCDFVSTFPHKLRKHRERDHSRPFQCELCDFQAAREAYLNGHMKKLHSAQHDPNETYRSKTEKKCF